MRVARALTLFLIAIGQMAGPTFSEEPVASDELAATGPMAEATAEDSPAGDEAQATTEDSPAGDEAQTTAEDSPAGDEAQATTEDSPAGDEAQATTEDSPAGDEAQATTEDSPAGDEAQATTEDSPAGDEAQATTEDSPDDAGLEPEGPRIAAHNWFLRLFDEERFSEARFAARQVVTLTREEFDRMRSSSPRRWSISQPCSCVSANPRPRKPHTGSPLQ